MCARLQEIDPQPAGGFVNLVLFAPSLKRARGARLGWPARIGGGTGSDPADCEGARGQGVGADRAS